LSGGDARPEDPCMNMSFVGRTFLRGLIVLLPLILTIWPLYYFFSSTDRIVHDLVSAVLPSVGHVPGSGLVIGVVAIFLLGLFLSSPPMRRLYDLVELPLLRIPLVKSLYVALKELTKYLAPGEGRRPDRVVLVRAPGSAVEVVGFVVREDLAGLSGALQRPGCSAVYVPMSYQIGGFTVFVPKDWLTPIDVPVEEAMRDVLTGWMTRGVPAS
jgi:uncharacterized membrane protein